MKYNGEDETLFENEVILEDIVQKYFVIRSMLQQKIIKKPPTDGTYLEAFSSLYKVELDAEEIIEIRSFAESEYADWKTDQIMTNNKGAEKIDLSDFGISD